MIAMGLGLLGFGLNHNSSLSFFVNCEYVSLSLKTLHSPLPYPLQMNDNHHSKRRQHLASI